MAESITNKYIKSLNLSFNVLKNTFNDLKDKTTQVFNIIQSKSAETAEKLQSSFKKPFTNYATKETEKLTQSLEQHRNKLLELDKTKNELNTKLSTNVYGINKQNLLNEQKTLNSILEPTDEQEKRLEAIKNQLNSYNTLERNYKMYGSSKDTENIKDLEQYVDLQNQLNDTNQSIEDFEKVIVNTKNNLNNNEPEKKLQDKKSKFVDSIKQYAINNISSAISKISENMKQLFTDAISEYKNMASYSLSTSLKINQTAVDQALTYGLSDSQNYALTKAMEELGATSEDDLYTMTPAQQERFSERIAYWTNKYDELSDANIFTTYENYQAEINDLKSELQTSVIKFFADNKDIIIWSLETGASILEGIMNTITKITEFLGLKSQTSASIVSDTINNTYGGSSKSTNIKIDNTFNGTNTTDITKLRNAGNEVNRQIIQALDD